MIEQQALPLRQISPTGNPFPGLRPFNTDETLLFFGRDGQSDMLLDKLEATRFVAVVGTSGSGKSSLVRAGLLPALSGGFMADAGSGWHVAMFRPINDPIGNLAHALLESKIFSIDGSESASERLQVIGKTLRYSSLGLIEVARQAQLAPFQNLLIVADQFEELFRFEPSSKVQNPKDEASAFVKLLLEATRQKAIPIFVILTMRSDYLGESARFWGLPEAINRGQFLIPRMDDDERREAIEGPVRVRGAKISWALVNRLLNDAGDDPQRLPILQHAMMRTWDYWEKHNSESEPIGIDHYLNSKVGAMAGALSLHADEAYAELSGYQTIIAEKMFKRLTEKTAGKRERRVSATVGEIKEVADVEEGDLLPIIEVFRREGRSFLMPPAPTALTADTLLDISHESLISGWTRLSQWVEEEADSAKRYQRLIEDALQYPSDQKLLTNPELQSVLLWRRTQEPNEVWAKRYYTEFGKALVGDNPPPRPKWAEAEDTEFGIAMKYLELSKAARNRWTILTTLAIAAGILLVLSFGAFEYSRALAQARESAAQAKRASDGERKAKLARDDAENQKATAEALQRKFEAQAVVANSLKQKADALRQRADYLLALSENERTLAERRGNDFAELGKLTGKVLAALSNTDSDTQNFIDAYQSMREYYGRERFRHPDYQDALDNLTVDAILKDNDWSVSEAFPYFSQMSVTPSEKDQRILARLNINFAQRIIDSEQRQDAEAIQFLKLGIAGLDDQNDGDQKANAYMQLGHAAGDSEEGSQAFSSAAVLFHSKGKAVEEAAARETLGNIYKNRGDLSRARGQYEEALKLFGKLSDQTGIARMLNQIQLIASQQP
jgi:tetratricopeptide (TPR) repeat protein